MDDLAGDRLFLARLETSVEANRRRAGALRFPLLAVAVANLAAAGWCLALGRRNLLVFYLPVLAGMIVAARRHLRRKALLTGVLLPLRPWALAAVGLAAGSATTSRIGVATGHRLVEEAGPSLVWVVGYHLLGRWGHNRLLMATTAAMVPTTLLLGATVLRGDAFVAAQLAANGLLLGAAAARTTPTPEPER